MKNNMKISMFAVLMGAGLLNLSNISGADQTISSTELSSTASLREQLKKGDEAEVQESLRVKGTNKKVATRTVIVRKKVDVIPARENKPAVQADAYEVTTDLEAGFCEDGVSCSKTDTFNTLENALSGARSISESLVKDIVEQKKEKKKAEAEEKAMQAKIDGCVIDEDGEEIKPEAKVIKCLSEKIAGLSDEEATKYYNDHIRERAKRLLQSANAQDRALAMALLGKVGQSQNLNCATRPNLQSSQNPILNANGMNPVMNEMLNPTFASQHIGSDRELMTESLCDMWAFGSYNNSVAYVQRIANDPSQMQTPQQRAAVKQAMTSLNNGWKGYFRDRGLILNSDPLGLGGFNNAIFGDLNDADGTLTAGLKAITERHKDLLDATPSALNAEAVKAAGRQARGGAITAQPAWHGNQTATSAGGRPAVMQPTPAGTPYRGAPAFGSPVGGFGVRTTPPVLR